MNKNCQTKVKRLNTRQFPKTWPLHQSSVILGSTVYGFGPFLLRIYYNHKEQKRHQIPFIGAHRIHEPVILREPHIITSHKWRTAGSSFPSIYYIQLTVHCWFIGSALTCGSHLHEEQFLIYNHSLLPKEHFFLPKVWRFLQSYSFINWI